MRSKHLISRLNSEATWLAGQAGNKRPVQADRDRVENISAACLAALGIDYRSYREWFSRNGFETAFRNRQVTAFTVRWNPKFLRLINLAVSVLELFPDKFVWGCPLEGRQASPAQRQGLANAREAKRQKRAATENATPGPHLSVGTEKDPKNPGDFGGQNGTFSKPSDSEKSPLARWLEKQKALRAKRAQEEAEGDDQTEPPRSAA